MTSKITTKKFQMKENKLVFRSLKGNVYRPITSNISKKYLSKKNPNPCEKPSKSTKNVLCKRDINLKFCLIPGTPTKLLQVKENKIDFNSLSGYKYRPLQIKTKSKPNPSIIQNPPPNKLKEKESIYVFTDRNNNNTENSIKPYTFQFPGLNTLRIQCIASNPGCVNIITKKNELICSEFINEEKSNSFTKFKKFKELNGYKILSVSCGVEHTVICATRGNDYFAFSKGNNCYGQLGIERDVHYQLNFEQIKIQSNPRFSQVYCGGFFTFLATDTAQIWSFGQNDCGQLGLGTDEKIVSKPSICSELVGEPIISIACGSSHSLALSSTGLLFAAGSNRNGQLGLLSLNDQKRFKIVDSMANVFISSVAAYTNYSAAIDEFGSLYVWGGRWGSSPRAFASEEAEKIVDVALGLDGRVAALTAKNKLILTGFYVNDSQVSQVVQIFSPLNFLKIFSGGEFFFVLTLPSKSSNFLSLDKNKEFGSPKKILALNSDHFPDVLTNPTVNEIVSLVFSSLSTINNSFVTQDFKENMASISSGVDVNGVITCYNSLLRNRNIMNILTNSFNDLLKQLLVTPPLLQRPASMRFLVIGLLHPSLTDSPESFEFWGNLVDIIQKVRAKSILKQWLSILSADVLNRILSSLNYFLSTLVNKNQSLYSTEVVNAVKAVKIVMLASARSRALSFDQFYNYEISQKIDLDNEFKLFQMKKNLSKNSPFEAKKIWCFTKSALFCLNADVKTKFIAVVCKNKLIKGFLSRRRFTENDLFFSLNVSREKVLDDTFGQIFGLENPKEELKKKLKVTFENEPAIDDGGVQREFFDVIVKQILDSKVNLFDQRENGYWFNKNATDSASLKMFKLVGIIIGMAIYNGNLVNIRFPTILYKKLKGQTVVFNDLKEFDSDVYNSLQNILTYEEDLESLYLPFAYGDALLSDDEDKLVTNSNREEFVECVTRYILDISIQKQFDQFKEGFIQCTGKIVLSLFRPEELALLVSGRDELNFYALMKATKYNDGYNEDSPTIRTFWRIVFTRLTEEEKKKLLFFVTASPRAPIGGLGALPFVISRDGDRSHLPTSHTCFFMLVLPDESDEEKLYNKIMIAIENSEGFAFK